MSRKQEFKEIKKLICEMTKRKSYYNKMHSIILWFDYEDDNKLYFHDICDKKYSYLKNGFIMQNQYIVDYEEYKRGIK